MEGTFNRRKSIILANHVSDELLAFHDNLVRAGYDYPLLVLESEGYLSDKFTSIIDEFIIHSTEGDSLFSCNLVGLHHDNYTIYTDENIVLKNHADKPIVNVQVNRNDNRLLSVSSMAKNGHAHLLVKDEYSAYGKRIARHSYKADNLELVNSTYFDENGQSIIVKDGVSGVYTVMINGKRKLFSAEHEFVKWYLAEHGYADYSVILATFGLPGMAVGVLNDRDNMLLITDKINDINLRNVDNIATKKLRNISDIIVRNSSDISTICEKVDLNGIRIHYLGDIESVKFGQGDLKSCIIAASQQDLTLVLDIAKEVPEMHFHWLINHGEMYNVAEKALQYDNITMHRIDAGQSFEGAIRHLADKCGVAVSIGDSISLRDNILLEKGCIMYKLGYTSRNISKYYYYSSMADLDTCKKNTIASLQSIIKDPNAVSVNYCSKRCYSSVHDYDVVFQQLDVDVKRSTTAKSLLFGLDVAPSAIINVEKNVPECSSSCDKSTTDSSNANAKHAAAKSNKKRKRK